MAQDKERNGRPLQRVSYSKKQANKKEWYKENLDWYIQAASFGEQSIKVGSVRRNLRTLYEVYNNQIPLEWFTHVTDPLNAKDAQHKNFPTKVRPLNILRTNIDLLLGEYPKRAFSFYVSNLGEEGYNAYTDGLNTAINQNLQQHFIQKAMMVAQQEGVDLTTDDGQAQLKEIQKQIPTPQDVAIAYQANYKDKLAIKGQNWLKRALVENNIRSTQHKMFKDWLITGEAYSFKGVSRSKLEYRRISPLNIDYDKSPDTEFIEDGDWVVCRYWMTVSDVVDMFYEDLTAADHEKLEGAIYSSPEAFYSHLHGLYSESGSHSTKLPVYHVCWKGRKEIIEVTTQDPMTGQPVVEIFDEDMPTAGLDPKTVKRMWVNSAQEGWAIGGGLTGNDNGRIYVGMGEIQVQRNEMNNFSTCKLPYNGRKYSDTHANNISVLEIGIPLLIMNIITGRALELTIAKSKGKILFIDKNAIPKTNGWDEEKFFYYSEALGYALLDRNQIGVDKSYNQYKVEDLSLFDNIKQLIELQQHYKQEWDDIIGITRQRKGQTYASDTVGGNEQALFQSTVITDMIFSGFDELVQRELQGMLDFSKFVNADGVRKLYNQSEFEYELLEIDPVEYASAELGIFITNSATETDKLKKMQAFAASRAQDPNTKGSTILEILAADNIAKLKATLKDIERIEMEVAQSTAEQEAQREQQIEEIKMRYMQYDRMLERENMEAEYDRKVEIEHIKGEYSLFFNKSGDGDNNDNGIPDAMEVAKNQLEIRKMATSTVLEQQKLLLQDKHKQQDLMDKDKDRQNKLEIEKLKARTAIKNKTSGEK